MKTSQANQFESLRLCALLLVGVLCIGAFIASTALDETRRHFQVLPLVGMTSLVILVGMAGLYYYAYKFYKDEFYALIAVGWLGNAIYIAFESLFTARTEANFQFGLYVYLFSQLSYIPFYIAGSKGPKGVLRYRSLLVQLCLWWIWIITSIYGAQLVSVRYPQLVSQKIAMGLVMIAGIPYASWTLVLVGKAVRQRLRPEIHGIWEIIFPYTFYAYAAFQPLYLFKLGDDTQNILIVSFCLALSAKTLNSISAFSVILRDFESVRGQLERKGVLEDLGALTASIEHDIKNPVQNVNNYVKNLELEFQHLPGMKSKLEKIKAETARIFAVTQIIKILRGDEYYERLMQKTSIGDVVNRSVRAVKEELYTDDIYFSTDDERQISTRAYRPTLQQAFVNILKNAVEAIHEAKREKGLVRINWSLVGQDSIAVQITDNGCGIPEDLLSDLGYFVSTKLQKKPNSGVGLFISKRILKMHRGKLEISSKGESTMVQLTLPRWKEQ